MTETEINRISILGLAYIGDCVFEMQVRMHLVTTGHTAVQDLHRTAVKYVNAPAQHAFFERISTLLSEEEMEIWRRGRNAKVNSIPKNATSADYHCATGLEALFGKLYLEGRNDRISELFSAGMAAGSDAEGDGGNHA